MADRARPLTVAMLIQRYYPYLRRLEWLRRLPPRPALLRALARAAELLASDLSGALRATLSVFRDHERRRLLGPMSPVGADDEPSAEDEGAPPRAATANDLLRELSLRWLPRRVVERPKVGFPVPLSAWLRGERRPLLLDGLRPERLKRQGLLNPAEVERLLREHERGVDHSLKLYTLLCFQLWHAQDWGPGTED